MAGRFRPPGWFGIADQGLAAITLDVAQVTVEGDPAHQDAGACIGRFEWISAGRFTAGRRGGINDCGLIVLNE